ncbi:MAG: hypothetical protein IKM97_04650 [Clostridia bacterium]|nr:hypothetical protein [Clostridia bacterium]
MSNNPKTIEELKQWYIDRKLPPEETTRFFIGKNYEGAKAFGIYMDEETEDFIVYKNKADGTRVIRYQGKNQATAVRELFLKLKDEIANQKSNNIRYNSSNYIGNRNNSYRSTKKSSSFLPNFLIFGIFGGIFIIMFAVMFFFPKRGYYLYNNDYYYYQNGTWYEYTKSSGWFRTDKPKELSKHHKNYYQSYDYSTYYYIDNFEYSGYYEEPSSDDDDWSSSDWDSGDSWDSSSTDWGSDW